MGLENERRANSLRFAGCVVERAVWGEHEGIPDLECRVCEVAGLPYRPACRISEPLVVWLGHIADVVEFFGRVVDMHVSGYSVDCTCDVVSAILDSPKPAILSVAASKRNKEYTDMLFPSNAIPTSFRKP